MCAFGVLGLSCEAPAARVGGAVVVRPPSICVGSAPSLRFRASQSSIEIGAARVGCRVCSGARPGNVAMFADNLAHSGGVHCIDKGHHIFALFIWRIGLAERHPYQPQCMVGQLG